jgi:hypothetical protein
MHLDYVIMAIIAATVVAGCWIVISSAKKSRRAKTECEDESTIMLTRRESLWLLDKLENPPPMNDKLKALMEEYRSRRKEGSDTSFEWDNDAKPHKPGEH